MQTTILQVVIYTCLFTLFAWSDWIPCKTCFRRRNWSDLLVEAITQWSCLYRRKKTEITLKHLVSPNVSDLPVPGIYSISTIYLNKKPHQDIWCCLNKMAWSQRHSRKVSGNLLKFFAYIFWMFQCLLCVYHAPSAVISPFGHVTDLNSSGLQGTSQVIELKLLHTAAVRCQCIPMWYSVVLAGWYGTLTMSYYNHLQSAYRHATICGHDATEQACYAIHVKSVSKKITCSYTSANKDKNTKKTNMIFHNPWSKSIQLLCQLENPQLTIGFITKWLELPRLNVVLEARLLAGWQHRSVWNKTHLPLEFGSSNETSEHWSFFLLLKREWCTTVLSGKSVFGTHSMVLVD